mgnify:CR=1 FL=1
MNSIGYKSLIYLSGSSFSSEPLSLSSNERLIKCKDFSFNQKQSIDQSSQIDNRYANSVYHMNPHTFEGSFSGPALYDNLLRYLWRASLRRVNKPSMSYLYHNLDFYSKHGTENSIFFHSGGSIDNFSLSVKNKEALEYSADLKFYDRSNPTSFSSSNNKTSRNSRAVSWSDIDFSVNLNNGISISSSSVSEFKIDIKNNLKNYYGANRNNNDDILKPIHISSQKREISGNIVFYDRVYQLTQQSINNKLNCGGSSDIRMVINPTEDNLPNWEDGSPNGQRECLNLLSACIPGIVFEIEEISNTAEDLIKTSVNFTSISGANANYGDVPSSFSPNYFEF